MSDAREATRAVAPETPMQMLKGEIERANARLASCRNQLGAILDRLQGSGPPSGKDQAAEAVRSGGLLPSSRDELILTHDLIGNIGAMIEQLDGTI